MKTIKEEVRMIKAPCQPGHTPVHEFRHTSTVFGHETNPSPDKPGRPAVASDYEKVGMQVPAQFEPEEEP
jgi:hypothetical protein